MAKNKNLTVMAYGTELINPKSRSNHIIRSRYMAAVLAIVFGIVGIHQFYLRNIVRGILKILFTAVIVAISLFFHKNILILIPVILSVLTGIKYLCQSDARFQRKNHVRTV